MRTSGGLTQAAASRVTLALLQCTGTLCGRLRNLIGKCCGACIRSRSTASRANGAKGHHARYLQIFRIIQQRNREIARLFDNPRRSHALTMLAEIRSQGLLTEDEFVQSEPRNARCHSNAARRGMKLHMATRSRFSTSTVTDSEYLVPWLSAERTPGLQPHQPAGEGLHDLRIEDPRDNPGVLESARASLLRESPQGQRPLPLRLLGQCP